MLLVTVVAAAAAVLAPLAAEAPAEAADLSVESRGVAPVVGVGVTCTMFCAV